MRSKLKSKKRVQSLKKIDVPDDVVKGTEGFERGMEQVATKLNMNRTQVKSVIKKLVEAPELLKFVKEMAGENSDSKDHPEVKMTRTAAR